MGKFRIGIAGLGSAAEQLHLPAIALLDNAEIVGAADPSEARRAWARNKVPSTFATVDELLSATRPEVLIVGTPPETHLDIAKQALAAGCHVFCEKPITPTVAEADALVEAARSAGRFVAVDNQYRHLSFYRQARAAIDRGDFGKPYLLQLWQQMAPPSDNYPGWKAGLDRLVLYEFGTHAIDLVSYLLGGRLGSSADGDAYPIALSTKIPVASERDRVDLVSVTRLDFPADTVATMILNWRSRAPMRYLEVRLDCERASLRLSLGGVARVRFGWSAEQRRPLLDVSLVRGGEVRVEQNGRSRVLASERAAGWVTATANHLRQFLAAVGKGIEPEGSARHARELLKIALATYDSAENGGRLVRLNDVNRNSALSTATERP